MAEQDGRCAVQDDCINDCIDRMTAAVRRGGAIHAFVSLNHFFLISQMVVPGAIYWNLGIGREIGEVERDDEGLQTMHVLGENMARLLRQLAK